MKMLRSSLYIAVAAAGLALQANAADVISFNAVGALTGGMLSTDLAGAPGVRVPNWNNMNSLLTADDVGREFSGALTTIFDNSGTLVSGLELTWSGTGLARAAGGGTNDQRMFESEWDLFDTANNTSSVDMTFTLTNVPFALYDVYFYVQDADNAEIRGGDVSAKQKRNRQ